MKKRITWQKEHLEQQTKSFTSFFTAEDLFNKVKAKKIGIATVYRLLKDLEQEHKLHSYTCNRRTIYARNKTDHCHFICEHCNEMSHFSVKNIDFLQNKFKGKLCHVEITVKGTCEKCIKKVPPTGFEPATSTVH